RDPKYTAPIAHTTCSPVTASMTPPSSTILRRLPWATPSSMIAALTVGRYSDASVLISWSPATMPSNERYGPVYRRRNAHSIPLLSHPPRAELCSAGPPENSINELVNRPVGG